MEEDRLFKVGVSDWEAIFDDGTVIKFDSVQMEQVTVYAQGTVTIKLENVTVQPKLFEMLLTGSKVTGLLQHFALINNMMEKKDEQIRKYVNLYVDSIKTVSANDSVTLETIVFESTKENLFPE